MMRNWTRHVLMVAVAVGVLLALVDNVSAQITEQKITPSGAPGGYFGWSTSISGNYAIVGDHGDNENADNAGAAYIFERDVGGGWTEAQKLMTVDGAAGDRLGFSVSISGDYGIVGAYQDDDGNGFRSGSAYIFERDAHGTWLQTAKLTEPNPAEGDYFGQSVAISGNYAIIGAEYDADNGFRSGSASVFERDAGETWTHKTKLTPPGAAENDLFGSAISISGNRAIIGSFGADEGHGWESGSAHIYYREGGVWTHQAKLTGDPVKGERFGYSVSISGDRIIIGATRAGDDYGAVYIFEEDAGGAWTRSTKLWAPDWEADDFFGNSVSIDGDYALAGAEYDDRTGGATGAAYVLHRDEDGTWSHETKLVESEAHRFGCSVSLDGGDAIAGAWVTNSAYIYGNVPEPATLSLLALGGLAVLRRHRKR